LSWLEAADLKRFGFVFSLDAQKWDACFLGNLNAWLRAPAAAPPHAFKQIVESGWTSLGLGLPPCIIQSVDAAKAPGRSRNWEPCARFVE